MGSVSVTEATPEEFVTAIILGPLVVPFESVPPPLVIVKKMLALVSFVALLVVGGWHYEVPVFHGGSPVVPFGQDGGGQ